jgi:hypothetical protein
MVRTLTKNLCIGGVSQNLKLANLNSRGRTWSGNGTSSGANPETHGGREDLEQSEGGDEYGLIRGFLFCALRSAEADAMHAPDVFRTNAVLQFSGSDWIHR